MACERMFPQSEIVGKNGHKRIINSRLVREVQYRTEGVDGTDLDGFKSCGDVLDISCSEIITEREHLYVL